jgi:hypothetical protein
MPSFRNEMGGFIMAPKFMSGILKQRFFYPDGKNQKKLPNGI